MPWRRRSAPTPASETLGRGRVADAFAATPRTGFLPADLQQHAGQDAPLGIGYGQTNSQPRTVADMLMLLEVRPHHRVLDIGAGSGWTTALLAHLCAPGGEVLGLEIVPELASWGSANLRAHIETTTSGPLDSSRGRLELARTGVLGDPEGAPWDRILVSAMATQMPAQLVDQLGPEGRMVIPVEGQMTLVRRHGHEITVTRHGAYRFVPLIGG